MARTYLACDLGAESGRLIAGRIEAGKLSLEEAHRFANLPVKEGGALTWNIPNLVLEIKEGLRKARGEGRRFESISADSWGVDYLLFDAKGEFMPPAHHYRDPRTKAGAARVLEKAGWEEIFEETGIQFMPINTLFQLGAEERGRLEAAGFLLGVGDACNYFLSGRRAIEVSMASTFQIYNPRAGGWSERLIEAVELPRRIFPEIVPSGTRLGPLREDLARELNFEPAEVIATCSHDTGAAVAGVPAAGGNWAYLSSGTWSLMGVELSEPVINEKARELNFTNEIGCGGTVRLLKNISGLWLIQECRRQWAREGDEYDYAALTRMAGEAPAFRTLINPADPGFLAPENMPRAIAGYCEKAGEPVPETPAAFMRCIMESLALLYRRTLGQLEILTGQHIERLHIVGGGSRNALLNQFTANATGIPVLAGPAEATAAGNIMIQAIALGHVASLAAAREIIRASEAPVEFQPRGGGDWENAFRRFERIP